MIFPEVRGAKAHLLCSYPNFSILNFLRNKMTQLGEKKNTFINNLQWKALQITVIKIIRKYKPQSHLLCGCQLYDNIGILRRYITKHDGDDTSTVSAASTTSNKTNWIAVQIYGLYCTGTTLRPDGSNENVELNILNTLVSMLLMILIHHDWTEYRTAWAYSTEKTGSAKSEIVFFFSQMLINFHVFNIICFHSHEWTRIGFSCDENKKWK